MPTGEKRNRIERITMVCRRVHCPIFCYLILAGLASMLASVNLNAQSITWQKTNGPYVSIKSLPDNVPINFLAVGPGDILFAASPPNYYVPIWGKLYRSTDRGVNWIPADSGWIPDSTKSLVFAQSGVAFMSTQSTDGCNVFVSTNGGRSWTIEGFLGGAHAFAVDSSGIIYWGGGGGEGVYKSTVDSPPWTIDDWQRGGMGNIVVDCLAALSNFKVIAGTWQGIMFSPDSAHTWLSTNVEDDGVNWFALLPNEHLFASSLDSGVFRSIDSGKTWTSTITGLPSLKIDGFSKGPDDYLYATIFGKGILMSTDEGGSWQSINGNLPSLFTYAVVVTSDSVIFLGTSEGLYCSSDHGTTWNRSAQGFSTEYSAVNAIAIEDSLLFAGGNGGIYLSSDDGVSWKQVGLPDTTVLSLFIEKGGNILAGTEGCGTYASDNGGESWHWGGIGDSSIFTFAVDSFGQIYAAGQRAIYRYSGSGTDWKTIWAPVANVYSLVVASNGFMYAANDSDGVVCSTDNGGSWPPLRPSYVWTYPQSYSLLLLPNGDILAGVVGYDREGRGVMRIPAGTDSLAPTSLDSGVVKCLVRNREGIIFAGTSDDGIYRSSDNGYTWQSVTLPDSIEYCLAVDENGYIYAGTPDGLFKSVETTLRVTRKPSVVPSQIRLEQNYPNPFNPSTTISYELSPKGQVASSYVTLKVYDILGRQVATLVDGKQTAGAHTITWNASAFASGVYFYKLVSLSGNQRTETTKVMVLIK